MTPLRALMQASVKPPSPMLAPEQQPLKPTTPMQPKNAPKTPNSHPQRRYRFHLKLGLCPQRRYRFQSRLGQHPQRRWRFQESGPPGQQGQAAMPMGGSRAWPGDRWAADVTNVVKPTRFKSPRADPCDKGRQSKPKNHDFQRKIPPIDDVCNNTHQSTPKTQHARPLQHPQEAASLAAVPTGSDDTNTRQMSHVIYRGHFSRHPKNVAIPTMQIQCLNEP